MTPSQRITTAVVTVVALSGAAFVVVKGRTARGAQNPGAPAGSSSTGGDRAIPVNVSPAVVKDVPIIVEGLGTVTPLATVIVKSQVDGRLDKVVFKEGDAVKKGDLLALIDPRPFSIQLQQGSAALSRDSANLKNAQVNLDRYTALRQQNLIPQQQVDDQRASVAQLEASTKADEATIASAKLNLDYARITSPIDGVTGVRQVDQGNIVRAADSTGIVVVTQLDPISVIFTLPQDDLPRVQKAIKSGKPSVEAFARDGHQRLGQGELQLVDNQVNAQTATIRLKATMPNPDRMLWPNQFVKARLRLEVLPKALVIPAAAIQRNGASTFVYVVAADKTVSTRDVTIASIEGDDAIITKGLAGGDVVVTDGQSQLRPGGKVAPRGGDKGKGEGKAGSGAPSSAPHSASGAP
jgi:multidrug efflux system membrane fusion protein